MGGKSSRVSCPKLHNRNQSPSSYILFIDNFMVIFLLVPLINVFVPVFFSLFYSIQKNQEYFNAWVEWNRDWNFQYHSAINILLSKLLAFCFEAQIRHGVPWNMSRISGLILATHVQGIGVSPINFVQNKGSHSYHGFSKFFWTELLFYSIYFNILHTFVLSYKFFSFFHIAPAYVNSD